MTPAGGPATASAAFPSQPLPTLLAVPCAHLRIEVLRRPVESAQYTSVHFTETLMLAGMVPSIGTVGDAYDNALAETTIGLYKTECVREGSPFRAGPLATLADLEDATSAWVHWYNTSRLMHRLGRRPPAEAEAAYYNAQATVNTDRRQP